MISLMEIKNQPVYYVVFFVTKYKTMEEVKHKAPETLAEHIARSKQFHQDGKALLAGAFLDKPEEPVSTMGIFLSRAAAEEYAEGDPFLLKGMISTWSIREWANMFA